MLNVIVAHNPDHRALELAEFLASHGFNARTAYGGHALLELAAEWKPEAAVVDLHLSAPSAFESARTLRRDFGSAIRLVGFAWPGTASIESEALAAGYDHVAAEMSDPAEILLGLGGPGAGLVMRHRRATFERACTLIELADRRLRVGALSPEPMERRRAAKHARTALAWVRAYLDGDGLEEYRRACVQGEVETIEALARLLEEGRPGS